MNKILTQLRVRAHPSSSIRVQVSAVSHKEPQKPQQPCWIHSKSFLRKLMQSYLAAWKLGLYCFCKLVDSEETARQSVCKDYGCRRQQAMLDSGCIMIFSPSWPSCPAYVLLSGGSNGAAPNVHGA